MTKYALTEAYSEIYNPRNVEDIFDNLRFVDYMLAEDIEEVVEEIVWEFRDYGNTIDEAFEMIDYALEDRVICESYDELINDILLEATVTQGRGRASVTSSTNRPTAPGAGSSRISLGVGGSQRPSGSATVTSSNRFDQGEVARRAKRIGEIRNAKRSVASRLSKLSGPISSVKQGISGAAGGMGRAAKALGSGAVERGKALLKGLLRRGGQAATSAGRAIERSGSQATQAGLTSRQQGRAGRGGQMELVLEPTAQERTGGVASRVGRAMRRLGASMQRRAGRPQSNAKAPDTTSSTLALPPARPETPSRRAAVQRRLDTAARGSSGTEVRTGRPSAPVQTGPVRPSIGRVSGPASNPNRPSAPVQTGPVRPSIGRVSGPASNPNRPSAPVQTDSPTPTPTGRRNRSQGRLRQGSTRVGAGPRISSAPTSSARIYPTEPSGQTTMFTKPVQGTSVGADVKVPRGGQKKFGATRKPKATERTRQMPLRLKEDYELLTQYIAEDIVNAGYAYDLYEAFDIIENLDEATLSDIITEYLD